MWFTSCKSWLLAYQYYSYTDGTPFCSLHIPAIKADMLQSTSKYCWLPSAHVNESLIFHQETLDNINRTSTWQLTEKDEDWTGAGWNEGAWLLSFQEKDVTCSY